MDPENTNTATRKVRFAPKAPPRRVPKPAVPKKEVAEEYDDAAQAKELMQHFNEVSMGKPKAEKKLAPTQVAFGYGGASSSIKSYGTPNSGASSGWYQDPASGGSGYGSGLRDGKQYKEPWDYYTYYPLTLPLRRPYSGNPELLDEEEFGKVSERTAYDENTSKPAMPLGLMDENQEASMFFFQLPSTMPMIKQPATAGIHENSSSSKPSGGACPKERTSKFDELPSGSMGKMLVYRSGTIKLKLGETLYDVSPGMDCVFAQDVVAINAEDKHCCVVGELNKRAIVSPDVDSILSSMADLG